jgi:hypothetical protein
MTALANQKRNRRTSGKVFLYNKKQAINAHLNKFSHKFEMEDHSIDLREMCKNFPDNNIPLQDVYEALTIMLGPNVAPTSFDHDPSNGCIIQYPENNRPKVYFDYLDWFLLNVWPVFQRDIAPNHVSKIFKDFDETSVIVPCIVKITLTTKRVVYCVWDGHHTLQVCRLKGWTKFPAWIIDADAFTCEEIENAGFACDDAGRMQFGCYVAGKNMRRINGLNKRPLGPYDDFMIGYETKDADIVSMMNILRKNNCVPKRNLTTPGAFTQIKSGIECYNLDAGLGVKGVYWDRALRFHRQHWPKSPLMLEVFRPLTYLYCNAAVQGTPLPAGFDTEFGKLLIKKWGDAESVQKGIKDSYWNAINNPGEFRGAILEHDKFRVLNGMINFYTQSSGKYVLPPSVSQWKIK